MLQRGQLQTCKELQRSVDRSVLDLQICGFSCDGKLNIFEFWSDKTFEDGALGL